MTSLPLMPKATAVWLLDNTTLTFEQIAEFCGLHKLEVQAIADGEVARGIIGMDPVQTGQLTREEIERCEKDPHARLKLNRDDLPRPVTRNKGPRYTPVAKRAEKPDGIAYLLKNHPELLDAQIAKLIGTTKETIAKVRDRTHWNAQNIKPRNPVLLGLCKQADLDAAIKRAQRRIAREQKEAEKAAKKQPQELTQTQESSQPQEQDETAVTQQTETAALDLADQEQPYIDPESMEKGMA